jgi:hypothetical protein
VLLLQANHHAAEVLADKVLEEVVRRVVCLDAMLLEELVGQVAAGLECEFFREAKSVVAVEENVLDLLFCQLMGCSVRVAQTYRRHVEK